MDVVCGIYKVVCLNTGEMFESISLAAKWCGLKSQQMIGINFLNTKFVLLQTRDNFLKLTNEKPKTSSPIIFTTWLI